MISYDICLFLADFTQYDKLQVLLFCFKWHYFILFHGLVILHCIYAPHLFYPFICLWTFRVLSTWTSPEGQHQNQIDYILCSERWRSSIQSAKIRLGTDCGSKIRLGTDCGSDYELLVTKLRLKLKKVGKTTRPFRYDLSQISYDYTVEVRNRLKGLDLIDRVPDELWTEVHDLYRRQGSRPSPRKRNAKKQNGCLRRPYKQLCKEKK